MTAADGTAVIVFARAPRPGAVKTRLIPLLGPDGAAALHMRLVRHALETAAAASPPPVELHCTPDTADPFFRLCAVEYSITTQPQTGDDLGTRMLAAFTRALADHARVLLIGSDCPALTPRHLREAEQALRGNVDAVFVPCEDGGYALIGLKRVDAGLFDGIAWGSGSVMAETRARLAKLGWAWLELETLWDVDRPEDYRRLAGAGLIETAALR